MWLCWEVQKIVYQKLPKSMFPFVYFLFSHMKSESTGGGQGGRGGGGTSPPHLVVSRSNTALLSGSRFRAVQFYDCPTDDCGGGPGGAIIPFKCFLQATGTRCQNMGECEPKNRNGAQNPTFPRSPKWRIIIWAGQHQCAGRMSTCNQKYKKRCPHC